MKISSQFLFLVRLKFQLMLIFNIDGGIPNKGFGFLTSWGPQKYAKSMLYCGFFQKWILTSLA